MKPTKKIMQTVKLMFPVIEKVRGTTDTISITSENYNRFKHMVWFLKKNNIKIQIRIWD